MEAIDPNDNVSGNELMASKGVLVSEFVPFCQLISVDVWNWGQPLHNIARDVHGLATAWLGGLHGRVGSLLDADEPVPVDWEWRLSIFGEGERAGKFLEDGPWIAVNLLFWLALNENLSVNCARWDVQVDVPTLRAAAISGTLT